MIFKIPGAKWSRSEETSHERTLHKTSLSFFSLCLENSPPSIEIEHDDYCHAGNDEPNQEHLEAELKWYW